MAKLREREASLVVSNGVRKLVLFGLGFSGAAALIYEVVWTRALSLTLGSTTYALSIMLAAFMAGLSLGGYLGGKLTDRKKNLVSIFAYLEIAIAIFGTLTLIIIRNISAVYAWLFYQFHLSSFMYNWAQFVLSFLVMLIPTTLMGATFPVVLKVHTQSFENLGKGGGNVYSVNSVGAVLGALSAGFLLIPFLGVRGANLTAAVLNFLVGSLILLSSHPARRPLPIFACSLIVFAVLSQVDLHSPNLTFNFYLARQFSSYEDFKKTSQQYNLLFESEDVSGKVQVFAEKVSPEKIFLVNHGKRESGTKGDLLTLLLLAWLPQAYYPEAKTFLNIGLGTGTTVRAALEEENLLSLNSVEINREILKVVKKFFYPELFENEKINHILADARNYLSLSQKKYDIISSQPSYPTDGTVSHLFTREFFELVKSHLNDKGVFCQWIPAYLLAHPDPLIFSQTAKMMLKTFLSVFPQTYSWSTPKGDVFLIGLKEIKEINPEEIKERIVRKLGKAVFIKRWASYSELLSQFNLQFNFDTGGERIKTTLKDRLVPLNTDDQPRLEFTVVRNLGYPLAGKKFGD